MKTVLIALAAFAAWCLLGYFAHGLVPYHARNTFKWAGLLLTVASQILLMMDRSTKLWLPVLGIGFSLFVWFSPAAD